MSAGLFRQQARARGPAAERLDERIRVAGAPQWLLLVAAAALVAGALTWALVGRVDRKVEGVAIVTTDPWVSEIESTVSGVVTTSPPPIGAGVTEGQALMRIAVTGGGELVVRSPVNGRLDSVLVARGEPVVEGDRLALVQPSTPLLAYVFVSVADGKQVRPGMPVRLAPGDTNPQDDGLLEGRVRRVLPYPIGVERLSLVTAQPAIAQQILDGGAPIEVDVALRRDQGTASGYRWTNGRGPSRPLTAGSIGSAEVVIGTERPVSLLLGD